MKKIASFLSQPFVNICKQSSLCEKKNVVCYIQISLFVPEIFKFLKYEKKNVVCYIQISLFVLEIFKFFKYAN